MPGDALYFHDPFLFIRKILNLSKYESISKAVKYAETCCLYGYFDLALDFIILSANNGIISEDQKNILIAHITKIGRKCSDSKLDFISRVRRLIIRKLCKQDYYYIKGRKVEMNLGNLK